MYEENKPRLFRLSVVLDLPNEDAVLEAHDKLRTALNEALGDLPSPLGYQGTHFVQLYHPEVNSGRCAVCGLWVTDGTKPDLVEGLRYGETLDGELLCDDHLRARTSE
jgi:hypothetical protein